MGDPLELFGVVFGASGAFSRLGRLPRVLFVLAALGGLGDGTRSPLGAGAHFLPFSLVLFELEALSHVLFELE